MIRTLYRSSKGGFTIDVPTSHWRVALHDEQGLFWVDFSEEEPAAIEPLWRDIFSFHPLAIDNALHDTLVPKIDNWGDYVYAVVHNPLFDAQTLKFGTHEVDVFLGKNYLITHHRESVEAINRLWKNCLTDQRRLERGADHLLYDLLDLLTADYMPVMDGLDDAIDHLEDEVFAHPTQHTLNTIFTIKRTVLHLRRIIGPQREVLNKLARDEYAMIDPKDRIYFRDVYDHLVRLADLNESLRDLIGGALDTYLSVTSNRINEVMKILTVLTALFMPISFLAGFFGMNFTGLPVASQAWLLGTIGLTVATPLAMLIWFRSRGWL